MKAKLRAKVLAAGVLLLSPFSAYAATYYVAPTGSDTNAGTMAQPFATIARGQRAAVAGDTVYFRGGTYAYTDAGMADPTGLAVNLTTSGTSNNRINYWAYQNETPVFDFSGIKAMVRVKGFNVTGSWLHLKGLTIRGVPQNLTTEHESWGIYNDGGSNNIYELLNLNHNMGPGFFLNQGGNNLILNSDSHHNYDPNSSTGPGTNADGFGCHPKAGDTGNVFRGCRSWWNSDDGWDFIAAQVAVTVENSWSWYNGYYPDSTTLSSGGDGNGIKAGGYGVPAKNAPAVPPVHTIRFCLSFFNRASGFNANHHPVGDHWYNNTAYFNNASDFNMTGLLSNGMTGSVGVLRNNIAYGGLATLSPSSDAASNSWTLPVTITDDDFQSVSMAGVDGPRQADGSLPYVPFMRLRAGSDLIDKGVNVGLAFSGAAPDLGAFEADGADAGPGSMGTGGQAGAAGASGTGGAGDAVGQGGSGGGSIDADASVAAGGSAGSGEGGNAGATGGGAGDQPTGETGGATGGSPTTGGNGQAGTSTLQGGSRGTGGATGGAGGSPDTAAPSAPAGCSCRTARGPSTWVAGAPLSLLAAAAWLRSKRKSRSPGDR